jgi:transposase
VTIVMGLDQHRAQITAEWLDTASGELSRARVAPADRAAVRRFAARFGGQDVEGAPEATTGWRFVVEELGAVGARVRLAEPAETAARRGTKKRAKSDRADARHLRELLMVGRLSESWIPPEHLLDVRARVRLRTRSSTSAASGSSASRPSSTTTASGRAAGCPHPVARLAGEPAAAAGGT